MRVHVKMPKLGLTMTEATIVEWRRAPGDSVTAGDILLVIETEKSEVEIEAPASGTLAQVVGQVQCVYPVGEVIAIIETTAGAGQR